MIHLINTVSDSTAAIAPRQPALKEFCECTPSEWCECSGCDLSCQITERQPSSADRFIE